MNKGRGFINISSKKTLSECYDNLYSYVPSLISNNNTALDDTMNKVFFSHSMNFYTARANNCVHFSCGCRGQTWNECL